MFARIAALGAFALLLTVPASQAASTDLPQQFQCYAPYQATPYTGPQNQVQNFLDNFAECGYHTHDADLPAFRILFVPHVALPEAALPQFTIEFVPHVPAPGSANTEPAPPAKESACFDLIGEPSGDPQAQPFFGCFRLMPAEPGPGPMTEGYDPRAGTETRAALPGADFTLTGLVQELPFFGQYEDPAEPQPLPGQYKSGVLCKAEFECRSVFEPAMNGEEQSPLAGIDELGLFPMYCVQVYPYSLVCSVPNFAYTSAMGAGQYVFLALRF